MKLAFQPPSGKLLPAVGFCPKLPDVWKIGTKKAAALAHPPEDIFDFVGRVRRLHV